jgi:hypothetical protein
MRLSRLITVTAFIALLAGPAAMRAGQEAPPSPKPGPEHEVLKMDQGTWDAVVEFSPAPGAPMMTSKGVETNTIGCGGLCLITDFKGETAPGVAFHGHGIATWDPHKKKYVGTWTDSMSHGLAHTEGTYDAAKKRFTGTMEGMDMTGQMMKTRSVGEYQDNSRVFTAYTTGPDGKEVQVMKISYTKKK